MSSIQYNSNWLIELLKNNTFIPLNDGLGTFIHKTKSMWIIRGRDEVVSCLTCRKFIDLAVALDVAKSLKDKFNAKKKTTDVQS